MDFASAIGGASLFESMTPGVNAVRKASPDDVSFATELRRSEGSAATVIVGIGATVAVYTKTSRPLVVSLIVVAGMLALYEYHFQKPAVTSAVPSPRSEYASVPLDDFTGAS